MGLNVETFLTRDERDHRYYGLIKTHSDVMRYTDQVAGEPILDEEQQITGYIPGHMSWCVAFGPSIKEACVTARHIEAQDAVAEADSGVSYAVCECDIEPTVVCPLHGARGGDETKA